MYAGARAWIVHKCPKLSLRLNRVSSPHTWPAPFSAWLCRNEQARNGWFVSPARAAASEPFKTNNGSYFSFETDSNFHIDNNNLIEVEDDLKGDLIEIKIEIKVG